MDKYRLVKPIADAPKDGTRLLLHFEGEGWIEGYWHTDNLDKYGTGWEVIRLDSHGCGCCATKNGEPDKFMEIPNG